MRQRARVDMHRPPLSAAMQFGHSFAGIEQSIRVKLGFHVVEARKFRRCKLVTHLFYFLHADAVLAGNRATDRDA